MSDKVTDAKYALEWVSDAESVTIRSALKFCFDIDARIFFSTFILVFFRSLEQKEKNTRGQKKS